MRRARQKIPGHNGVLIHNVKGPCNVERHSTQKDSLCEEQHDRRIEEAQRLAQNQEEMARLARAAEEDFADFAEHLAQADRGRGKWLRNRLRMAEYQGLTSGGRWSSTKSTTSCASRNASLGSASTGLAGTSG